MDNKKPQIEDGYTKIANEILDALSKINLSSYQTRVLFYIFRKTYGFNKKEDWISISQIVKDTKLKKSHASRTKKELLLRQIVTSNGNKIAFQKDSRLWTKLPVQVTVTNSGQELPIQVRKLPVQGHTKDNNKRQYTKESTLILSVFNKTLDTNYKIIPQENLNCWLSIYSVEEITQAIKKIPQNEYWKDKMTPTLLFRKMNPRKEAVDYIGQLLNTKDNKKNTQSSMTDEELKIVNAPLTKEMLAFIHGSK